MPAKDPSKAVVLVADDEPSMLSLIAQHVKTLGHDVHIAHDGEEAWDKVQKHRPDLVLLDVMMPAMSGWEVCRKVREDEGLDQVGVIMITGIGETLNELTSPLFGADAYLDKPFELVDLDRSIREVLTKRRNGPTADGQAKGAAEAKGGGGATKPKSGKGKAATKVKGELLRFGPPSSGGRAPPLAGRIRRGWS
ncbi:MAG TPA: response regulator [Polyangiaceae bacterium]|nr:response regulator [Polyangiaceae bacterium]